MHGLYLITNDDQIELLLKKLEVALATKKVAILQYRRKKIAVLDQPNEVEKIKQLCEQYNTPLVINDDLVLAARFGLGVHLGQSDGEISDAKQSLPAHAMIGRTCLNSLDLAEKAIAEGASYVAFGAIFATQTKPEAGHVGIEVIRQARQRFEVPICAIGGLTVENSQAVIDAGAHLCAVISDILAKNPEQVAERVHQWAVLFHE